MQAFRLMNQPIPHRTRGLLWGELALFVLTIVYVYPLRETATCDDWAYARTCWGLVQHGHYEWHPWLAANIPFQALWGGLFAKVMGCSFGTLRFSTLALTLVGAVAFFGVALETGSGTFAAALLTGALLASPLVVRLSFSFMTNVPFLALLLLALWLYARGLRQGRWWVMGLGSLAATAAILTRQFGIALIPGLIVVWAMESGRWRRFPLVAVGVSLPALAGLWQIWTGMTRPAWGALYARAAQEFYFRDKSLLLLSTASRPAIVLQYLAWMCLPLVLVAGWEFFRRRPSPRSLAALAAWGVGIGLAMVCVHLEGRSPWMPYLPWHLGFLAGQPAWIRASVTLITASGAALLARIFWLRWFDAAGWRSLSPAERLLDLVSLCLIGMHLVFFQLGDEYILVMLPFTLIAVGKHLGNRLFDLRIPLVAGCLLVWAASAEWTRGLLAGEEAQWQAAESVVGRGVPPGEVYGPWTWVANYRFEEYLEETHGHVYRDLKDFWGRWMPEQRARARFLITEEDVPEGEGWSLIEQRVYRGHFFVPRCVRILERRNERGSEQ